MLLLSDKVTTRWSSANRTWLIGKGYPYTKLRYEIEILIVDLPPKSNVKIPLQCDYCNSEFTREYNYYYSYHQKGLTGKDACKNCLPKRTEEDTLILYGVSNISKLDSIKEKKKNTTLQNHGVVAGFLTEDARNKTNEAIKNEEVKLKRRKTNIEKYGVENVSQSEEIKEKRDKTVQKRYGVNNVFQLEDVKNKSDETMIRKFGVRRVMQDPNIMKVIISKRNITAFKNNTIPYSKQQKYIHSIIGGEFNFPIDMFTLDVAYLEDKIYLEYQGSGHNLGVKIGNYSEEEFRKRELNRYHYLKRRGWKLIEIISLKDQLPNEMELQEMIKFAKMILLNNEYSRVVFDIDNAIVSTKGWTQFYSFGELLTSYKINKDGSTKTKIIV
jgi:hypothetical protein